MLCAVIRLRRYLESITITPVGIVILLLLVLSLGTFAFGPSDAQAPGLVAAVVLAVFLLGANMPTMGAIGGQRTKTLDERRAEVHPHGRSDDSASSLTVQDEEELWRKERERYQQLRRSR
jgi:hypothetical protein